VGWWLVEGCGGGGGGGGGGGKWRDEACRDNENNLVHGCIVRGRYDAMSKVRKPTLLF